MALKTLFGLRRLIGLAMKSFRVGGAMIETVTADRFDGVAKQGRTGPLHLGCARTSGESVDVLAKFTSPQCAVGGLVREVFGALLLRDLGVRSAVPVLVQFDDALAQSVQFAGHPQEAAKIRNSAVPAYGSVFLDGFRICRPDDANGAMGPLAAEVWAFDQLIFNGDRRLGRPNCLTNGMEIALIDHELTLDVSTVGSFLNPAPWTIAPQMPEGTEYEHIFLSGVRGKGHSLERLEKAWTAIDSVRVQEFAACIPKSWPKGSEIAQEIVKYLLSLRGNLSAAFTHLRNALS